MDKGMCACLIRKGHYQVQCKSKASFEHEGKMYCGLHHPPTAANRKTEHQRRRALFDQRDRERRYECHRKAARFDELLSALAHIASQLDGDLQRFAIDAILKAKS